MKRTIQSLLLFCLAIMLVSCIKDNRETPINIEDASPIEKADCCYGQNQFDYTIISTTSPSNGSVCCTYEITYTNNSPILSNCHHRISTPSGIKKQKIGPGSSHTFNFEFCRVEGELQSQIIFQSIVAGSPGSPLEVCETLILDPFECTEPEPECNFTYAQGFNTGCNIGNSAEAETGCCDPLCSNALQETIELFQEPCPEYIDGVIAGFAACNCSGGGNPDPTLCGGVPAPAQDCECINNNWECQ